MKTFCLIYKGQETKGTPLSVVVLENAGGPTPNELARAQLKRNVALRKLGLTRKDVTCVYMSEEAFQRWEARGDATE